MRPIKRFFLYCFYCTLAYFTRENNVYAEVTICQIDPTEKCNGYEYESNEIAYYSCHGAPKNWVLTGIYAVAIEEGQMVYKANPLDPQDYVCQKSYCPQKPISGQKICYTTVSDDCKVTCSHGMIFSCPSGYWGRDRVSMYDDGVYFTDAAKDIDGNKITMEDYRGAWCNSCPDGAECSGGTGFICKNGLIPNYNANTCECDVQSCLYGTGCVWRPYNSVCNSGGDGGYVCNNGYYRSDKNCVKCPENSICETDGTGYTCISDYYNDGSSCIECPANSDCNATGFICKNGYYPDIIANSDYDTGYYCFACPEGTAKCNSPYEATKCKDNYYLNDDQCYQCPENSNCTSDGFNCKAGYYESGSVCVSCGDGVATCNSSGAPLTCKSDYYLYNTGECRRCPDGAECSSGVNCTGDSYYESGSNKCYRCPADGAESCGGTGFVCATGYYYSNSYSDPYSGATCTRCPGYLSDFTGSGFTGNENSTSVAGAKDIYQCYYRPETQITDEYGTFTFVGCKTFKYSNGSVSETRCCYEKNDGCFEDLKAKYGSGTIE